MCQFCMARSLNELHQTSVCEPEDCLDNLNVSSSSLSTLSTYLTEGFWSDNFKQYRKWNLSDTGFNAKYGEITYSLGSNWFDSDGINSNHATLTRYAFQYLENITGINFTETSNGLLADIAFGNEYSGAFANYNTANYYFSDPYQLYIDTAYVNIPPNWFSSSPTDNDYLYQTILHEIGHVLGLGHQSNYNSSASFPTDADFGNDSWLGSMMSYFDQSDNTNIDASFAFLQSCMAVDFLAFDDLYGNQSYGGTAFGTSNAFTGDTTYGFNTTISESDDYALSNLSENADVNAFCIVDGAGNDTLDCSGWSVDQLINLTVTSASNTTPTTSNIAGLIGNLSLAANTVIENAVGGSGNDIIYGNQYKNYLNGGDGIDTLYGGDGIDTLYGGDGIDYLLGQGGDDNLWGGNGGDVFYLSYSYGADVIWDFDQSLDSLYIFDGANELSAAEYAISYDSDGYRTYTLSDSSSLTLYQIYNNDPTGSLVISGTATEGSTLSLADTIADVDGLGSFTYQWFRDGSAISGATSSTYILTQDDVGAEITASVTYTDGYGSDETVSSAATDLVAYGPNITSATSFDMDDLVNSLNLTLTGSGNIYGYGNNNNNTITGNSGNNTLKGGAGNDYLNGGSGNDKLYGDAGNDRMLGGSGNDTYYVDSTRDRVYETTSTSGSNTTDAGGTDRIYSTVSLNMDGYNGIKHVEHLTLQGSSNIYGYGNNNNNTITGNSGNNTLKGGAGNDKLYGGKGKDVMLGGSGADTFAFVNKSESSAKARKADNINDFQQGVDVIDLSAIDASVGLGGNDAFNFNGTTAFGTDSEGEIRYKQFDKAGTNKDFTMVYIDTDSDRSAEMSIKLKGLYTLTEDDFIL